MQKVWPFWERIRSALAARLELRTEWESGVRTGSARADAGGRRASSPTELNGQPLEMRIAQQTRQCAQNAKLKQSSAEADMDSSGVALGFLFATGWSRNTGSARLEHKGDQRDNVQVGSWLPGQREPKFSARINKKAGSPYHKRPCCLNAGHPKAASNVVWRQLFIAVLIAAGPSSDQESTCDSRNRCPGY
jgi:hypothetical protein